MTTLGYTLLEHQRDHVQDIVNTLSQHKSVLDLSLMGRGKTYTTSYVATVLKSIVVVVCPASVETKWKEMKTKYNAPIWKVISYESLRGVKHKQPKHGLLKRTDKKNKKSVTTSFRVNPSLSAITKKHKVLFVFDEVQKTKNKSATAKACIALVSHACMREKSKVMLLSGTPIDKNKQSINILRMMGLITSNVLAMTDSETDIIRPIGFRKLHRVCTELNPVTMLKLQDSYNLKKRITDYPKIVYDMFIQIVLKYLSSKMPDDVKTCKLDIRNRYFVCSPEEKKGLKKHISSMKGFFNKDTTELVRNDINAFGAIQKALLGIEKTKVGIIARNAYKVLTDDETTKVCIMVNYTEPLKKLNEMLSQFNPIIVNGSVPKSKRIELLEAFQSDSLESRLVIANMEVLSTGVDLDDKFGNRKRYVFASPNYKTMVIQQMAYRFLRANTKSNTTIDFVYGHCDAEESSILGCLCKKACTMREASMDQKNKYVMYPDQYPKVIY
jgi:superfamily II DNA or RNA helicase